MSDNQFVDVKVMGYEFRVACPTTEVDLLKQSVDLLNQRMSEIKMAGKIIGLERIAMMAALSMSHDHLKIKHVKTFDIMVVERRIEKMNNLIDTAINPP